MSAPVVTIRNRRLPDRERALEQLLVEDAVMVNDGAGQYRAALQPR